MTFSPLIRSISTFARVIVAVVLAATALLAVPGAVGEASAQTGVCPVGTTLGTTSWGTGTGGMVWNNNAANQLSGASETYNNVAGQVDMTLSYIDPDNVNEDLDNPYLNFVAGDSWDGPVYTQTNGVYGANFFTIVMNSLTSEQTVDWSFGFSKPVFVPDFTISDVDWAGDNGTGVPHDSFQDEVVLAGQRGGNNITTTAAGGTGIQDLGNGRLVAGPYASGATGNVGPNDAAGTVSLTTVGPVTSFNMQYSNGPADAANDALNGSPVAPIPPNSPGVSNNHAVAISNFTVCAGNLRFGDLVWADVDGDGIRDAGEPGIPGVVVSIADPAGNVVETQTTAADGSYEFEQFPGFTWVVSIAAPAGYTSTYDRDGGDLASTAINPTTNEFDIDFGLQPDPGTIAGSVFTDLNNNGLFNAAQQEVALPGVTVELTGQDLAGNTVTGTTTTAADGSYTFTNVPAGVYQVAETQPAIGFTDGIDTPGTNATANGNDQHEVTLATLESSAGNNFAEVPTSSISGNVYEDDDDSASLDSGEAGIGAVPITVAGTDAFGNAVTFNTTTAGDGTYTVDQLVSGTYSVTETSQPSAYADGQESAGSNGGTIAPEAITAIALGYDDDATDYNFGELPTSSIAGNVTDEAGNPIGGVTITLTGTDDLGDSVSETTTTAADGSYSFIDLRPGTYTVTETQPAAYGDGPDSVGTIAGTTVGTVGNDVLSNIAISVGDNGVDYDFTETLGSIAGSVVDDGGNPIAGVTIDLAGTDANGQSVAASTTTATDGTYEFDDLVGGTYTVTETQPAAYGDGGETAGTSGGNDSANDVISAISLGGGVDATGYDFDETRGSLSGQVFVDPDNDGLFGSADSPAPGVTLTLTGTDALGASVSETTTTAPDGSYTFTGLIAGTYQIDETQPAAYVDGIDTVGSEGGTDTVNDRFSAIALGAGVDGTGYDFAELPPAGVTGSVTDSNGDPISGVTLTLTGTSTFGTSINETTTTAGDGSYSFFDLPPGTYTVTETQPTGYGDGPDSLGTVGGTTVGTLGNDVISGIVLDTDSIGVDYDFTETYASIAGTVVDDDGTGIAGVTITLTGTDDTGASVSLTTTTATDGTYSFDELLGGTYTVTETQPAAYGDGGESAGTSGGDDSTVNDQISGISLSPGINATGYDFDETRGSLRGRVYEDTNNNGASNSGEPRIAGVTITLTGTDVLGNTVNRTTTTNTSGNYRFDDLLAGTYTITESQPAGYADGIDTAGSPGGDLSVNDVISGIPLAAGQIANGYYFGEILPSSISGTVFIDDNDNGAQNSGEAGIGGVAVDLTGTDDLGNTVTASTTTAADGTYSFTSLRPGTYTVTETQPGAFLDGTDAAGSAGGTVADDVISAITLATNTNATGYDFGELEGASISGTVVDDGGNPIESVTLTLSGTDDLGNTVTASTTTAGDGTYTFGGLRPGTYTVTETQPAAYGDGGQDAGTVAGTTVGDDTSVNDQISGIVLPVAADAIDYDFDETRGSVAGVVFEDTNNNGTQDSGEPGISGASVRLTGVDASGTPIDLLTTTSAGGGYVFEPLLAGTYTVTETQPAGYLDGIDSAGTSGGSAAVDDVISSIVLAGGADATANNFGELLPSDISGTVVDDAGTGITSVAILLSGTNDLGATVSLATATAADGTYSFTGLRPGTYTVAETQPFGYLDAGETAGSEGGTVANDVISAIILPSDTSATGYDFDEIRASSIAGTVVDDGGNGIAGVTLTLTGTDDLGATVTASTTTASGAPGTAGTYSFTGLRPGTYTVTETQPAAYGDGGEDAGSAGGDDSVDDQISAITLPANTNATGYDFDETRGSITGLVYEDTNNNGTQDSGEPAISGTLLQLSGTDVLGNTVLVTGTSQGDGTVVFGNLLAGDYDLDEIQPPGYLDGIDTAGTSGGTVGPDEITAIALVGGANATGYTFGELLASSISGTVFDDDSGNGTQQSGESGIGGVAVDLTGTDDLGNTVTASTTTAGDGTYGFTGLRPGTYTVTETQPGAFFDGIDTAGTSGGTVANDVISAIALASDTDATGYDFAEIEAASIAGTVADDAGTGIAGVTIALSGTDDLGNTVTASTTTASGAPGTAGTYSFTGLRPGTYTVTETQPAAYGDGGETAGTAGGDDSVDDVISAIALGAEEDATGYDFDETRLSIAGTVYEDLNGNGTQNGTEPGIAGVTIELTGTDVLGNTVALSTTTAGNGSYSFDDLLNGTYTVAETQPAGYADAQETIGSAGGTNSVNDEIVLTLAGADATGYDFGEVQDASIAGSVVDDASTGIAGVTITLTGTDDLGATVNTSTTTAANGTYSFAGLRPGTYTVTETQPAAYGDGGETAGTAGGAVADDLISAIDLASGEDATGYDFDESRGSIAGVVFEDTNNNGTQDSGEPAISGVTVELAGTDVNGDAVTLSTTTAANGSYSFDDLLTGTYTVTETQPSGYLDGIDTAGSAGGTLGADEVTAIALAGGNNATGYDFGELLASSISGTVVDDAGAGIVGVTLTLTGTDDLGAAVNTTVTTIADGTYSFDDLRPGTYTVTETQPTGYLDGGEDAGTAGGDDSVNDVISAITLPSDTDATGYDFDELLASSISGTVVDDGGNGIAGVTIALSGTDDLGATVAASTTTAADGTYGFNGLRPGTYTVTETQPAAYGDGGETAGTAGGTIANDEVSAITLPVRTDATGYDFDETRGAIAGTVYEDLNGNAVQNGTEPGIAGVTVELTGTDVNGNTVALSTTTAGNGRYSFDDLLAGTYTVAETQPTGYADGQEAIGSAGGTNSVNDEIALALTGGTDATGYDFGEVQAASIAGSVVDDAGTGIAGVTITLTGTDDLGATVNTTATTIADGSYSFNGLRPGTYTVTETQPTAYGDGGETAGTAGGDDTTNDVVSGIALASGEDATGYDFDETRGSIAGVVFEDTNNNGTQDTGEPAISGVTIELTGTDVLGNTVALSTTTATNGSYSFDDLLAGTYDVTETQPTGYLDGIDTAGTSGGTLGADEVTNIALTGGTNATGYTFGEIQPSSIAGTVVDDAGTGIAGVTLTLTGTDDLGNTVTATTTTATNGTYNFDDLRPGTYTVTETQPTGYLDGGETAGTAGGTVADDVVSAITLGTGTDATGYDFDEILASSIAGSVVDDGGNGIAGAAIDLTGTDDLGATVTASTTTAADGTYSFDGLRPGTYTVTETQPAAYGDGGETAGSEGGTIANDEVSAITLPVRTDATGYDFDETRGSIAGTVYEDLNGNAVQNGTEPGISGVTVELTGTDVLGNTVALSTTTAGNGSYAFNDLLAGTYTVVETQPVTYGDGQETIGSAGGTNSVNDEIALTLTGGINATGYDFGEIQASSIAGSVVDDGGNGIENVTVTLTGTDDLGATVSLSTTTAADGSYGFGGLRPGTYTIAETQPVAYGDGGETAGTAGGNDTANDVISAINLASDEDATGYDFDETRGSIAGVVYEDLDGNGTQNGTEPGISGVTVELTGADVLGNTVSLSTTTAGNGSYSFGDLLAGAYTVVETQPTGYADGQETVGSAGGTNSVNDEIALALTGGTDATGYDFGEVQAASIAGSVVDDAGTGIAGVAVALTGTDDLGATVTASTTTAANGTYSFAGLRPGTYTVTETQPAAYGDGGETAGTAGGDDTTNDAVSGIALASGEDATGYDFDETRGSIAGVVFEDTNNNGTQDTGEPAISGVTVELDGTDVNGDAVTISTTTATNGSYSFDDLLAGTYDVTETQPSGYLDGIDTAGTSGGTLGPDEVTAIALTGGTNATGYTFGELLASSISGTVVDDAAGGIENVTITLTGTNDLGVTINTTTTTASDGTYSFTGLRPGAYTVTETQPTGYLDGGETAGSEGGTVADDVISAITLPSHTDATDYDFDELLASTISGTVVDDGGNGIAGVAIALTGTDDLGAAVTDSTTTAADGTYSFDGLRPGTYTVTEAQPIAYGDGGETAGTIAGVTVGDDTVDDVISAITLPVRTDATGYDFDEIRGSIAGTVYEDLNGNAVQNGTEPGIAGVTIELTGTDANGDAVNLSTTTAGNGSYSFDDLLAGTYTVTETQPTGYADGQEAVGSAGGTNSVNDEIDAIALTGGTNASGYDFGEVQAASVSGAVVDDGGNPIGSVTITLTGTDDLGATVNTSTTTANDGTYSFTSLRPGTYTITETQPAAYGDGGETAGTAGGNDTANDVISAINLASGEDATGYDFDETRGSIAGVVFEDTNNNGTQDTGEPAISGVTVELDGTDVNGDAVSLSTTTATNGSYSFDDLLAGTYDVTETQPAGFLDGIDTPGTSAGTLGADQVTAIALTGGTNATGYTFGELLASGISGTVVDDAGAGIVGVTLTLTGTNDLGATVNTTATTIANGTYSFTGLRPGTYTITETQPAAYLDGGETAGSEGGIVADDVISAITLASDTDATGYDFDELLASSIAGTVVDDGGNGIAGVAIALTGTDDLGATVTATTTTAANGTYSFDGLRPGTYTVTETQPAAYGDGGETAGSEGGDDTVDDVISAITLPVRTDATGYDFDETRGSIAGTVYEDLNGNAVQNGTEPGISGVTVDLTGTDVLGNAISLSTTTATNGSYSFGNLLAGTYTVAETQPTGYADGQETIGSAGGTNSVNDQIAAIGLTGGTNATGYDFGEVQAASIAGSVVDDGGNPIGSVTITLTGTDDLGATINTSTTTANDGTYSFAGLRPGTYTVTETQPAAYGDGGEDAGTAGGNDTANDVISAINLASGEDATGYDFDETRGSIAGVVFEDTNNNGTQDAGEFGIGGASVRLTGVDATATAIDLTVTTIADGSFVFTDLVAGTYRVTEIQPTGFADGIDTVGSAGGTLTNDVVSAINLTGGDDATGYTFGEIQLSSIAGTVVDDAGTGIAGVTITLTGTDDLGATVNTTTTTLADGSYAFNGLRPGTYTVTETQPAGYLDGGEDAGTAGGDDSTDDVISTITLPTNTDATGYDFDEVRASSIAGTVVDDGGNGIAGVTITLTGTDDLGATVNTTVTTIADGSYSFTNLRPGTYTVTETQPGAYGDGGEDAGTAGGTVADDVISAITLAGNTDATGYDFDETRGSIAGTVYEDLNGNAVQNTGEPGIAGVTVELDGTDVLGNTVSLSTTTAGNGSYSFGNLLAGTYTVAETQPAGYADGQEAIGSAGGTSPVNDQIAAIGLTGGTNANGYDFGEVQAASIAGSVVDDAGTGIAGVTITLTGTDDLGAIVNTTVTTIADGSYSFTNLRPGTYTITETQPAAYGDGGETAGTAGGNDTTNDVVSGIALASGEDATGYDFDETRGSIAGVVFEDTNNNGTQDTGEPAISGVTVALAGTDVNGDAVSLSATTATNGSYSFDDLLAGTYDVTETQPTGYLDGIDTAGTSGGTLGADEVTAIALTGGTNATGYTFGEIQPSSIAGTVVDDAGTGIAGVTITLTGTNDLGVTINTTTTTASDGTYSFTGLRPGAYTVTETQPTGYLDGGETAGSEGGTVADDVISAITLPSDSDATGYNFDEVRASSIAGTVVDDAGDGIENVTITLTGTDDLGATVTASTATATNGTYSFTGLRPGTYTVTETQPAGYGDGGEDAGTAGGTVTDDAISAITLAGNTTATGYDFDETRGSIAGVVFEDTNNNGTQDTGEPAISGVTVELTGTDVLGNTVALSTTTAANGSYAFGNLIAGTYDVTETQPTGYLDGIDTAGTSGGTVRVDAVSSIALTGGTNATGYTFGELLASSISGTVVDDAGTGITGVVITLTGTNDLGAPFTNTTSTAVDGTYNFAGLRPGTYTVTETQPTGYLDGGEDAGSEGGTVTDDAVSTITLPSDTDAAGYDFDEIRGSSISGTVVDDADDGIAGVTVTLTGTDDLGATVNLSTTTAGNGTYSFDDLRPGTYTITETQPVGYGDGGEDAGTIAGVTVGVVSDDQISAVTLPANSAATGYDFDEARGSIAGTVYEDLDGNGVQNGAEPGIAGVAIELTGTDDRGNTINLTATTAGTGNYIFGDLFSGTYTVSETQPAGYIDGQETIGSAGGTITANDEMSVTLPAGFDSGDYDFGEVQAASLAGTVYIDADNSGSQNGVETGIAGVIVTLSGNLGVGNAVSEAVLTAADGTYSFTGLLPGTYVVSESQPAGFSDGIDRVGSAGGTLGNDQVTDILIGSGDVATGYDFGELEGASISGTVVDDAGDGIPGTTMTLSGTDDLGDPVTTSTTTGTDGSYSFNGLRPGTYTITETQPTGYGDGGEVAGTSGGTVTDDQVAGIVLGSGQSATGYDFDETRASLSGSVYLDTNGNGIRDLGEIGLAGVPIELTGTDDLGAAVTRTTSTATDGTFVFSDLIAGTYAVTETTQPAGLVDGLEAAGTSGGVAGNTVATNDTITGIVLAGGVDATDYVFGEWDTSTIGGTVVDELGNPIPGVTLTLTGVEDDGGTVNATAVTGPAGVYTFTGLEPGTYTVTETQPAAYGDGGEDVGTVGGSASGTATNDQIAGIDLGPNESGINYDFDETLGSISGTVFEDANGNGALDSEPGIAGVTMTLTGTDANGLAVTMTTTTGTDGSYTFNNVIGGTYSIAETQPAGFLDGGESIGSAGGTTTVNDVIAGIVTTGGADETGYDFGEIDAASISGSVVDDGGNPIPGTTITLTGTDDLGATVNLTDTTDVTGVYSFDGLRPGTYTVTETQPLGYGDGGETAGPIGGTVTDDQIAGIVLGPDTDATGNDFDEQRGAVSGRVFEDLDSSSSADLGEPGINGVTITLTGTDILGATVNRTTTTSGDGDFSFGELIAGDYTITETQPAAFADGDETVGTAGGNAVLQNDAVSSISIGPGAIESGYLFGEVAPVSVSGTVFNDSDNDGSATGEAGIGGVTINLTGLDDRGQLVNLSTTTASGAPGTAGTYSFTNLRPGVYTVSEVQPAGFLDGIDTVGAVDGSTTGTLGPDQITGIGMTSGQAGVGYDFGELDPSSLSGSVVDDLARPIAGVTIVLTGTDDLGATVTASTTTASGAPGTAGTYSFDGLRPGSYTITETQPAAYGDGGEDAGVIGGTTIGLEADDEISAIVLGAGADGTGYDFDETTASIAGQVFVDNDGDTVPSAGDADLDGVAIQLSGTDVNGQTVSTSTTTATDGTYAFDGLLAGDYTITETQPTGFIDGIDTAGTIAGAVVGAADNSAGGDAISGVALTAGSDSIGNDFSEVEAGSISGSVVDDGGNGIAGVAITLTGTDLFGQPVNVTTTTGLDGSYTFTGLAPGTYTVTETQPLAYGDGGETAGTIDGTTTGTTSDDEIAAITLLSGQDGVGYDFNETRMSISGTVVIDDDNDGVADVGEAPIAGVTLSLTGTDVLGDTVTATTTTAANGTYSFEGLLAGDYTITETQPAGFLDGAETVGSAGGTLGADSVSGITLLAGVDADAYDFGELDPASLGGSVEDDLGRPIAGTTVTLTGTDDLGAPVTITTTTDADGNYVFDDLRPGTYTITETQPVGYGDGGEVAGTLGGTVTDDQISDIVVSSGDTGTGYDFDETTGSLAGSVVHATGAGDAPIAGVAIDLTGTDANGDAVALSTTTAADGTYVFDGLLAGDYTITETQPVIFADGPESIGTLGGDATVNDVIASIPITPGADGSGYDFAEVGTVLSGQVQIDLTGDGVPDPADDVDLSGIVIELIGTDGSVVATTTTAVDGTYAIGGLVAGDYTVRQTQPTEWGSISSNELPVTLPSTGLANVDFIENGGSISGTVFNDDNVDGTDDQGTPESGVTVTLSDSTGVVATTTTDANGNYTFNGLPAADYTVTIDSPTDSTFTGRDQGNNDAIDSDVDPTNGTVIVTVPAGADVIDIDAGIVEINRDLSIVITTDDTNVNVGDEVTFTTTVTNTGNTTITGGVTVTIPVPANTEFVSANGQGWTITVENGVITATRPDQLAPGEVAPPIVFTVETTQVGSVNVTGQVVSSSGLVETTTSNNVSSVPITVSSVPTTSIPNLAYTGGSVLLLLLIAGGLIFSGQALTLIGGRRNEDD